MFTRNDARWLSETALALYAARTVHEFSEVASIALHRKFSLIATACEELGVGLSSYALHHLQTEVRPPDNAALFIHDNPFRPTLTSGKLPALMHVRGRFRLEDWQRTDHYNGLARSMGWNDQCLITTQFHPSVVHIGTHRDTIFTSKEIALMALLQPHLAAAWTRVKETRAAEFSHELLRIPLSSHLRPRWQGSAPRQVLHHYFPHWRETDRLPSELHAWVAQTLAELRRLPPPRPLHAFTVDGTRGRLLVRCFPPAADRPSELLLVERLTCMPVWSHRTRLGLTVRESEILHWLAQGKRDAEIAVILGLAPGTVSKHVAHLRRKFGATSRSEVVYRAMRHLG